MLKDQTRPPHVPVSCKLWDAGRVEPRTAPCYLKGQMKCHHVQTPTFWSRQEKGIWKAACRGSDENRKNVLSLVNLVKSIPWKISGQLQLFYWCSLLIKLYFEVYEQKDDPVLILVLGPETKKKTVNFPQRMHFCSDLAHTLLLKSVISLP